MTTPAARPQATPQKPGTRTQKQHPRTSWIRDGLRAPKKMIFESWSDNEDHAWMWISNPFEGGGRGYFRLIGAIGPSTAVTAMLLPVPWRLLWYGTSHWYDTISLHLLDIWREKNEMSTPITTTVMGQHIMRIPVPLLIFWPGICCSGLRHDTIGCHVVRTMSHSKHASNTRRGWVVYSVHVCVCVCKFHNRGHDVLMPRASQHVHFRFLFLVPPKGQLQRQWESKRESRE